MSYQSELYQQVILDHNKKPRNFHTIDGASHSCDGNNPLCGDEITVYVNADENGTIQDLSFTGSGCAISKASSSLMTGYLKGKNPEEVKGIVTEFLRMVKGEEGSPDRKKILGKLTIFEGVRAFPSRIKCASLAWHTVTCALEKKNETSTE